MHWRFSLLAAAVLLPACARPVPVDEPAEPEARLALIALDIESPDINATPTLLTPVGEPAQLEVSLPNGEMFKVAVRVAVVADPQEAGEVTRRWASAQ